MFLFMGNPLSYECRMGGFCVNIYDVKPLCIFTFAHTALRAPKPDSFCRKRKRYSVDISRVSFPRIKNVKKKNTNAKKYGDARSAGSVGLAKKIF